ncbi:MAG TPA: MFS transporter [Solirubrobacteraceae bacterium]|jgi:EmrB/QacA subfamily drug resistance transporter|nr:MFS transporter [Solirubrobacteraceae bacterium]
MSTATAVTDRSRWVALYVLCAGMLMIVLDVTIVNVALPSIQNDLGFSSTNLAWVVNAYLIAFGGLLMLAGRLGDLLGRRSVFLGGVSVFTAASLACGLADSQWLLVAARFVQGAGGAMTSAVILGMIVTMFSEPRERAKAIGVYAFVASAGGAVGLLAGGLLTQALDWHWIFFVNVPIGIATVALASRLLERDAGIGLRAGADVPGATLITAALMLGVYAIVGPAAAHGWGAPSTLAFAGGSIALLVAFVIREATASRPLVPLGILRSRTLAAANVIQVLSVPAMFGMFFLGALYLRRVLGYDALQIGLAFLPVAVSMGLLSIRYAERLATSLGARATMLPGLALITAGLVLFALAPVHSHYVTNLLPTMLLLGIGAGMCFPALMNVAMSAARPEDAGLASGLLNTTAQVGGALGLAVLATLSNSRTEHLLAGGARHAAALTGGYQLAFWIAAGLAVASIAVVLTLPRARQAAAHTAREAHGERAEAARLSAESV